MKYIKEEKLKALEINKDNTYLVLDFDRTITDIKSVDSWDASITTCANTIRDEIGTLYQKYIPIELNYMMSRKEKTKHMQNWYHDCIQTYYQNHYTKDMLDTSIQKSNIVFRKGAKELIQKANQENVPIIILSAGIGNVIKEVLQMNQLYTNNIYIISNFIQFDKQGNMLPYDKTLIHTLNKTMNGHLPKEMQDKIANRRYKILAGDVLEDQDMVEKEEWESTLKVGFLIRKEKEHLNVFKEHFDMVLTKEDATFEVIHNLLFKDK